MKLAATALMTALFFALPAWAGTDGCPGPDTDSDGVTDVCDNCSAMANPTQLDAGFDGYGNVCDCDFDNDNLCSGSDFLIFGANFGTTVPPCPPDVDMDGDGLCSGSDFLLFGGGFGAPPGPACGAPKGTPCPPPFGP